MGNNFAGGIFFIGWWESDEEWFCPFKPFSKLNKQNFVHIEHQLKSKLAWPVGTEYEVKIKMVQEQWQLKMKFLLGYKMKIVGGNKNLVGGWGGRGFRRGEWGNSPHPPVGKPCSPLHGQENPLFWLEESLTSSKNQIIGTITYSYMESVTPN